MTRNPQPADVLVAYGARNKPDGVEGTTFAHLHAAHDLAHTQYHPDAPTDLEEWIEDSYRLLGALTAYDHDRLWVSADGRTAVHVGTGTRQPMRAVHEVTRNVGVVHGAHVIPADIPSNLADHYYRTATFRRHAGRVVELGHYSEPGENVPGRHIEQIAGELFAAGHDRVFVKVAESKQGVTVWEAGQSAFELFGDSWVLIQHGGCADAFLVQEFLPLRFEYRMFVIGHEVVCGAGRVVEHTPMDGTGQFSTFVREHAADVLGGVPGPVVDRPDVVAQYVEFARHVVTQFQQETPDMLEYVLDVALGPHGPVIVELNGVRNAGFYGNDAVAVALARKRVREQHPDVFSRPIPLYR